MLVLSRKAGEWIMIGDQIKLQVVDIRGDKVIIGIEAPQDVPILRAELLRSEGNTPPNADCRS